MRQAPRSPLTLSDLRSPSPSPAPTPAPAPRPAPHAGTRGAPGRSVPAVRKLGCAGGVLHAKEGSGAGAGATPSPGGRRVMRYGVRGAPPSPQELRLSHLGHASPSPSPPASCSSYYDSINSDGPAPASPAPDRLMQVEVAFEWSPVTPQGEGRRPPPTTQVWPHTPASHWLPRGAHSPTPAPGDVPPPWPPDSLEGAGVGFDAVGHVTSQLEAMNVAARRRSSGAGLAGAGLVRGRMDGGVRVRPRSGGHAPRQDQDQDLNSRVHQILTRIASGAP